MIDHTPVSAIVLSATPKRVAVGGVSFIMKFPFAIDAPISRIYTQGFIFTIEFHKKFQYVVCEHVSFVISTGAVQEVFIKNIFVFVPLHHACIQETSAIFGHTA